MLLPVELIQEPNFYQKLSLMTEKLVDGMADAVEKNGIKFSARRGQTCHLMRWK